MAGNPACQSEDGNLAVFIGTNLDSGDSITFCPSCLLQFCATLVESMTGVPVAELIDLDSQLGVVEPESEPQASGQEPESEAQEAHTEAQESDLDTERSTTAIK